MSLFRLEIRYAKLRKNSGARAAPARLIAGPGELIAGPG
jgi:hypothetical protein